MADQVEVLDAPQDAPPGAPADSPPPADANGDPSTPTGDAPDSPPAGERLKKFDEALNALKSEDDEPEDSPPRNDGTKTEGQEKPGATKDEPAPGDPKPDALSQEVEKAFNERPEWKGLLAAAGKNAEKAKPLLRQIFQRETALAGQVKTLKPDAELGQRLKRATNDEQATANAVALVEAWFAGKPEALEMLKELSSDLEGRLGQRLTSPDLVAKSQKIDEAVEALQLTPEEAQERKALLHDTEKARAGQKRAEGDRKQTEQQRNRETVERMIEARTTALNDWERLGPLKNPDYAQRPEIRERVQKDAQGIVLGREEELGRMLTAPELVECAQKAYDGVLRFVNSVQPKRAAQKVPATGSSSRTAAAGNRNFTETVESAAELL